MDPEGVRDIFYAESAIFLHYGVREAIKALPFRARSLDSRFVGVQLPLTRRLPRRLDIVYQQYPGLHAMDAVVLADIDPTVFDADDLQNLAACVEAGGGLLLLAGPNSFSRAQRNWGALREVLPVDIPLQTNRKTKLWNDPLPEAERAELPVAVGAPHPVTRGIVPALGQVSTLHPMTVREGAQVLATAGGAPLLVAREYGRGRVLVVGASPDGTPEDLFASPGWPGLLMQGLTWLMGRQADLMIERCNLDASPLAAGQSRSFTVEVGAEAPGPFAARAAASQADPGWLSAGREAQYGEETAVPVSWQECRARVDFTPPAPGRWRLCIEVSGEGWANTRAVDFDATTPANLRLRTRNGKYVLAPGWTLPLHLWANGDARGTLVIVDFDGNDVLRREGVSAGPLDVELPELEPGEYQAIAEMGGETACLRFQVVMPLQRIGLTFAAPGGHGQSEERVRWGYEYFRERGFNAFGGSLRAWPDAPGLDGPRQGEYAAYLAQRDGFDVWGEYLGAAVLSTHAHYGDEGTKTTRPCVLSPEYPEAVRAALAEKHRGASAVPRAASIEILDEPHLLRANVCHCDHCRAAYRARFGYDMPDWDEAIAARDRRTRDYFEWVVDYAGEAFRQGWAIWKSLGRGPCLHHVVCAIGNGHLNAQHAIAEDLAWVEHADFFEFDCYNYMYPHWRPFGKLRWNEFHYMFGHFRFLALRNGQRMGFFIQVTDRDVPAKPYDPLRAPSETLYAALGGGAKAFHLMAQGGFTFSQNCREEKFDTFAGDIKKVLRAAPLLDRAESPRSHVAMTFPFHDRLYRTPPHYLPEGYIGLGFYTADHKPYDTIWPNHKSPINLAELLFRVFGETDVVDQRAFHEGALDHYQGFVLNTTDYITGEDARAVARFVEEGGVLLCDHVPGHFTDGAACDLLAPLFSGQPRHFYRDITLTGSTYGKGKTLLISGDLNELYTRSIEEDDPVLRDLLEETVRGFFFDAGLRPHVLSTNPEIEVNLLQTPDTRVLVAVNHADTRQASRLVLYAPPFPIAQVRDLVTMERLAFTGSATAVEIAVELDEREGVILGCYPAAPVESAIRLNRTRFTAGERLYFSVELTDERGTPARGDQVVEVRVTDPRGDEHKQFGGLRCAANGILRIEAPLAVNARPGEWTITAFDRFTTRQETATFHVDPAK